MKLLKTKVTIKEEGFQSSAYYERDNIEDLYEKSKLIS